MALFPLNDSEIKYGMKHAQNIVNKESCTKDQRPDEDAVLPWSGKGDRLECKEEHKKL